MKKAIPSPTWLTGVLRDAGLLASGWVTAVDARPTSAFNSATSRLRIAYSDGAHPRAPAQLVLKRNLPAAWAVAAGAREVRFYQRIKALGDHPPLTPRCYAANHDPATGQSYLLLDDLSSTHAAPVTREEQIGLANSVPSPTAQEAVVDALAALHAYWWEHPLLESSEFDAGYWRRDKERLGEFLTRRKSAWHKVLAQYGEALPDHLRATYESLFHHFPGHWRTYIRPRFQQRHGLTLSHGDTYFSNFLCPRPGVEAPTYLLDWQSPSFDLPGLDLVNLLATFWTRAQRREDDRERDLLRRYHASLQAGGVRNYSWDDVAADYRHGLIFWMLTPLQDAADGSSSSYWQPKLNCLLAAYRDWRCTELLT